MILTREFKEKWTWVEKLIFRFVFSYFTLYTLGVFLGRLLKPLVLWVGKSILNIQYDYSEFGYGSGDNTYQYILTFTYFLLALIIWTIWSLLDFKRKSYNNLFYGFRVLLRFVLIYFMFIYGLIKLFHLQMIPPTYSQLIQTLGEMSPMRLAWVFMGYSKGYSMFAGGIEVLAGLLLIFRKTVIIGALVTIGVMTQVFIMNMCFDIPVKIFSFHLFLMGIILFIPGSKRLLNAVILGKSVKKLIIHPVYKNDEYKIIQIAKIVLLTLLIWFVYIANISTGLTRIKRLESKFSGDYKVEEFQKIGDSIPKNTIYKDSWTHLILDTEKRATIHKLDGTKKSYLIKIDSLQKELTFTKKDSSETYIFNYKLFENKLHLKGFYKKDSLNIKFNHKRKEDFFLTNRKFQWVNEVPLNR